MNLTDRITIPHRVALVAVLLLAAWLRLWNLSSMPPGLYHDEAYNGLDAISLLTGEQFPIFYEAWEQYAEEAHGDNAPTPTRFPVFFEGNYGREPLHVYLMSITIGLLGATPFAIRLVPAIAGILAVAAVYAAGREFMDERSDWRGVALGAAFLLAVYFPSVHFSRFGLRVMLFLPISALAVRFFWRGWKQNAPASFLLSGVFIGIGLYTYAASRLFPLVFVAFILIYCLRLPNKRAQMLKGLALMGGAAFVVALPLLLFFLQYPYFFIFRLAFVANKGRGVVEGQPLLTWAQNLGRVIAGMFWHGETHLRHNLPGRPFFDPLQAGALLSGIVLAIRRLDPGWILLFIWFGVMLLPSIMSGDAPHFGRMAGMAAPASILGGRGLNWVWRQARTSRKILNQGLFGVLIVMSATLTVWDYFGNYAQQPQLAGDFYLPAWETGQFAATVPGEPVVYLSPTQAELATQYFALGTRWRDLHNFDAGGSAFPLGILGRPSLYLFRTDEEIALERARGLLPAGEVIDAWDGNLAFWVEAAASLPQPETRLEFTYEEQIQLLGYTLVAEESALRVTLFWQAREAPLENYQVFLHLLDSAGEVVAQEDRSVDGYPTGDWRRDEIVTDTFQLSVGAVAEGDYQLVTGFYSLPTIDRLGDAARLQMVTIP